MLVQGDPKWQGPPIDLGGEPPDNAGMEARVAKLEVSVEYIQRDISEIKTDLRSLRDKVDSHFVLVFGAIISMGIGLAGLMAKGFNWL